MNAQPICKPNVIFQAPLNPQITINTPSIDNQLFEPQKVQINIENQQLNTKIQPPILQIKFNTPIINNEICTDVHFLTQTQIIRDTSTEDVPYEDVYTDSYVVTPTRATQILFTDNKYMKENIIINPIPKNYGLVTWNGSYLTIS